jgi:acyl carrier protein
MLEHSAVSAVVRHEICALLSESGVEINNLADSDQLHDLGLNSLLLARLIIQLEAELGVDPFMADATIADARSVGALVAVYEHALAAAGLTYEPMEHRYAA